MNPEKIRQSLFLALTHYDASQQKKASYNRYAFGQYVQQLENIMKDIEAGASVREAIIAGFCGPILTKCLKAVGEPKATEDEISRQGMFYVPVKYVPPVEMEDD